MIDVFYKNFPSGMSLTMTAFPLQKFTLVREDWRERFGDMIALREATPVAPDDLKHVHDPVFVDGLLTGNISNPLTGRDPAGAEAARWDVGAFVSAARSALLSGKAAASIGGGFHHAGYRRAHAFCTFNGLMTAYALLKADGCQGRVGVLDLDAHFGDGTQSIIDEKQLQAEVAHYCFAHQMLDPEEVDGWLEGLPSEIERMHREGVGILLYNAGVDPHVDDPMVRGVMTTVQIRRL